MAAVTNDAAQANNRRFVLIAPRPSTDNSGNTILEIHPLTLIPDGKIALPEAAVDGQGKSDGGDTKAGSASEEVNIHASSSEEAVETPKIRVGGVRCRGCHFKTASRQAFLAHVTKAHALPALQCANCTYFCRTASSMAYHLQTECEVLDLYNKRTSTADKLVKVGGLKRKRVDGIYDDLDEDPDDVPCDVEPLATSVEVFDSEGRNVAYTSEGRSVAYTSEGRAMSPGSESTRSAPDVCSADEGLQSQDAETDNTTAGEQIWVMEETEGEEVREWKVELEHQVFPEATEEEDGQKQAETESLDGHHELVLKSELTSEKVHLAKFTTNGRLNKKRKKKRLALLMVCPCPVCGESFDNVFYLSFHLNIHHPPEEVKHCSLCSLETKCSQVFLTHLEKCIKDRIDFTDLSAKRSIMTHDILKHYAKEDDLEKKIVRMPINTSYADMIKDDGTYECTICLGYMSVRAREMRLHISKRHTQEGKILCRMCDYFGYECTELREHIAANHQSQGCQMRCLRCPFQATRLMAMRLHDTYHEIPAPTLTCPHCSFTTGSEASWQNHRRKHVLRKRRYLAEKKQRAEARKKTRSVLMSCPQCSFVANSTFALEYHTSFAHTGLAPDPDSASDESVLV